MLASKWKRFCLFNFLHLRKWKKIWKRKRKWIRESYRPILRIPCLILDIPSSRVYVLVLRPTPKQRNKHFIFLHLNHEYGYFIHSSYNLVRWRKIHFDVGQRSVRWRVHHYGSSSVDFKNKFEFLELQFKLFYVLHINSSSQKKNYTRSYWISFNVC